LFLLARYIISSKKAITIIANPPIYRNFLLNLSRLSIAIVYMKNSNGRKLSNNFVQFLAYFIKN